MSKITNLKQSITYIKDIIYCHQTDGISKKKRKFAKEVEKYINIVFLFQQVFNFKLSIQYLTKTQPIMKKALLIVSAAVLFSVIFTSCKEMTCKCKATGAVSEEHLDYILNRHIDDCVEIADKGPIMDEEVYISCNY